MAKSLDISMKSRNHRCIQAASLLVIAWSLTGCSSLRFGTGDFQGVYLMARNAFRDEQPIGLEQAAAVPYASMGVRVGGSNQIMLVLATSSDGEELWTSAAQIAITTRKGRIVRTAGLQHNISGYQERPGTSTSDGVPVSRWIADFTDIGLYAVPIACKVLPPKDDTITILNKEIRTKRVDERCKSESERLDWSFTNRFWLDERTGFTWRSRQWVSPKLGAIEIDILRPPH
jgi:hypothetical protein